MQYNTLLTRIAADIYSNGAELITGDILQNVLNEMVGALASAGACYKGTITPASAAPLDLDQPTVYLALTAGTYTNFVDSNNDPIVTTGPALITYDGGASLVFSKTDLPSGSPDAVLYTPQALTDSQKAQARTNIGAASASDVTSIESYIPAQASSSNQLADKNFVNSSIQTNTATFRGTYYDLKAFVEYSTLEYGNPDNNDYAVVRNVETSAWDADNVYQADEVCLYDDGVSSTKIFLCIKDMVSTPRSITPDQDTEYWKEWMNIEQLLVYHGPFVGTWRFKYVPNGAFDITNWQPEYQVNEKPLTAAQLAALNSGITDTKVAKLDALPATIPTEVFWATYGTTTAADIEAASAAGKAVYCLYDSKQYTLAFIDSTYIYFSTSRMERYYNLAVHRTTNVWQVLTATLQNANDKVSSIDSTNYDSAVKYASLAALNASLYKWGVISQTQTWSGSGSQPRTYTIDPDSIVRGSIPQANIDLFESAGATFNATTGYFELNGLTDISYEEMKAVYDASGAARSNFRTRESQFAYCDARTLLPIIQPYMTAFPTQITTMIYHSACESIGFYTLGNPGQQPFNVSSQGLTNLASNCEKLKKFVGIINISSVTNANSATTPFAKCYSLEDISLKGIKVSVAFGDSPNLSKASLLYMINNEAATSTIVITLHPSVYAKTQTGGEWKADVDAALANHPNVQLGQ